MPYQCVNKERKIYFKKDYAEALRGAAKIIFDFDGVLVQSSHSYRQTIRRVIDYYFLEILSLEGARGKLTTLGEIQSFKDTGLFNNDWTLTHAIITYYLTLLMRKLQKRQILEDFMKRFRGIHYSDVGAFLQTLGEIGDFLRRNGMNATELIAMKNDSSIGIKALLARVGLENQPSPEVTFRLVLPQAGEKELGLIEKLVPYRLETPDLLKHLFEESYLGEELFSKFYDVPSIFKFDESFLEKEEVVPTKEILKALFLRFGEFGIYSEKPKAQGMYLLEKNGLKGYFNESVCVFQEDLIKTEKIYHRDGERIQLGKPNPTLFIRTVEKVGGAGGTVYVGDSVADALLVENARLQGLYNILFFGVLCSSRYPSQLLPRFIEHNADAVMTDMNDIPRLYAHLEGEIQ